jgi:hypothetical protein
MYWRFGLWRHQRPSMSAMKLSTAGVTCFTGGFVYISGDRRMRFSVVAWMRIVWYWSNQVYLNITDGDLESDLDK